MISLSTRGNAWPLNPLWLAIALVSASPAVLAQNGPQQLDTLQITGERVSESGQSVSAEALERRQASELQDIFADMPDVAVGGGAPAAQKVYVRGLEDTMLNVTVDGATQSGYLFHHQGRLVVEPELLKQVDIVAGAGEATNGPGALGGAIRFVTKDPEDLLRPGQSFGALLKGGYFSNTDGYRASASLYGRLTDNWSGLAMLTQTDHGDYKDADGNTQPYTGSERFTGFAKLVGQLTDEQRLRLSYERSEDEAYRLHRPHWIPSARNAPIDQEVVRETVTGNYGFTSSKNDWLDLDLTLYHTEASLEHINGPFGDYIGAMQSHGGDLRNHSQVGDLTLTYGVDYRKDEARLRSPLYGTDREEGSVVGLYLQNHYQLTERLRLSAGARHDWFELDEHLTGNSFSESGWSPNLGLRFDATEQLTLHGGWARAIRGTQVKELFVLDYYRNAEDRKEEVAENVELGATYRYGNLYLAAEVFETRIDDVVGQVTPAVLGNLGELKTRGFNARIGYDWDRLEASLAYSRARPELEGVPLSDDDMAIGTSIGDTWVANVNFQATDDIDLGWTGRFAERLTKVADGYPEKAGYGVNDIYASWHPLVGDQLTLSLRVNNVFDKQYFDHASYGDAGDVAHGLPDPGRDFRLSATYRF
ncbi:MULTISPECIES: TonB-dependent receptor domain-containing protein [Halomonadaceae]|jgi:hemoglobin/transferrin/lactoferrin receptor protein|uniref:TonB-dependent receptor n=1 Tax=Billgrantia aerodenitrificans TaxID=2733483 RepID=A0ABS9AS14_9GAMM|nr:MULTISPECIES: TonB-dependent receptor [Halomonas]MCE8024519.1 TonB-dependent receptor [Halomonas aerodenitrificans]MCE8036597.1 TonB-dependent receptor [Halomonas sp. MCCC 1A11062]